MESPVKCPICGNRLFAQGNSYSCAAGHSFDIAKEGYVNLLPANAKKSALPGDNKIMVNARNLFLSKGYFYPLAHAVAEKIESGFVLDAGCGTGYYGKIIKNFAEETHKNVALYGIDISKFAVRRAAKNAYDFTAVSSVFNMPFYDGIFDYAVSIFAPVNAEELYRVLKFGGKLITVSPAENHLIELKRVLYKNKTYLNPPENAQKQLNSKSGKMLLFLKESNRLSFSANVRSGGDIETLFTMTPYFYKTRESEKSSIFSMPDTDCTFDFYINLYEKQI